MKLVMVFQQGSSPIAGQSVVRAKAKRSQADEKAITRNQYNRIPHTVMFLSFRTDRSGQTVPTHIRVEQSDQGLYCLQFPLHLLDALR